ncbi:phage protein [Listeria fleischmannii]|uniref:Uncharacterized protein n=1 Tax=Listeria fleischmannii FSL S10-1203 TaxID=1265822 RepID=W7D948_9LIST|nr:hypothetical protein [Listeria fleischmannii]EUJ44031.1 hypothetical protein MCOL2_20091 [Listeria fleischmannii FSL S10-1203]
MTQKFLWMREIYVRIDNGRDVANFQYKNEWSNVLEIHFSVPFSDEPKPEECNIEIYNLSQASINKIKKGAHITLQAGYKGDVGLLSQGKITSVTTRKAGVDKVTSILFSEGIDYSDKKDVNITFKKWTKADTIIRRVASSAGIKIYSIHLPQNKSYKSGYTADGDALSIIEEIVKDCKAAIYFRRGNLVIRSIQYGDDERFVLNDNTGLVATPERFESDELKGWTIRSLLQHRIATASIITLNSSVVKGSFRVKNGNA